MEPHYNEVLGTMKITLLYQVSHYIRVKRQRNIKSWDQQIDLVIRGFCYIRPLYNEVPLYFVVCSHSFHVLQLVELSQTALHSHNVTTNSLILHKSSWLCIIPLMENCLGKCSLGTNLLSHTIKSY